MNNREFSLDYIQSLIQMISQENSLSIRNYERPLLRIVQLNDKHQVDRVKRLLTKLHELFKTNTQFFLVIESLTEIILKLCIRSPIFSQSLVKSHGNVYQMIDRYY